MISGRVKSFISKTNRCRLFASWICHKQINFHVSQLYCLFFNLTMSVHKCLIGVFFCDSWDFLMSIQGPTSPTMRKLHCFERTVSSWIMERCKKQNQLQKWNKTFTPWDKLLCSLYVFIGYTQTLLSTFYWSALAQPRLSL